MTNRIVDFIRESNRIEGIKRNPTEAEIEEYRRFMALDDVTVEDMVAFVKVYQPNARLRDKQGLNVRVGNHFPIPGGAEVKERLKAILYDANEMRDPPHAWGVHCEYETLHPF